MNAISVNSEGVIDGMGRDTSTSSKNASGENSSSSGDQSSNSSMEILEWVGQVYESLQRAGENLGDTIFQDMGGCYKVAFQLLTDLPAGSRQIVYQLIQGMAKESGWRLITFSARRTYLSFIVARA